MNFLIIIKLYYTIKFIIYFLNYHIFVKARMLLFKMSDSLLKITVYFIFRPKPAFVCASSSSDPNTRSPTQWYTFFYPKSCLLGNYYKIEEYHISNTCVNEE